MTDSTLILLLLPLIVIEIGLLLFALRDLIRPERKVRGDSKLMWGLIICLVSMVGPILYLVVGRDER
jgi:glucose uptake protein GlcU